MTEDASPENLRKFLESDDPALVRMGISMAKGVGVEVTVKDLEHFLKSKNVETIKIGFAFAEEVGVGDEAMEMLCEGLGSFGFPSIGSREVSASTALILGEIGDDRAVEPLIETLASSDHDDYETNEILLKAVIGALGNIGGEKAVEGIADALTGWYDGEYYSPESTDCAAAALTKIGEPAVGALMEFVTMKSNDTWPTMDGIPVSTLEMKENAARIIVDILGTRKATDLLLNTFVLSIDEHGEGCGDEEYDGYYESDWQCDTCCALETCFCVVFALSESEDKRFLESVEKLQKYIDADSQKELYSEPDIEERYGGGKSNPFIYLGRHFDSYQKLLEILE